MGLPSSIHQRGTRAAQPTPNAGQAGIIYFVTDESKLERWSGSAWESYAVSPSGASPGGSNTQLQYNNAGAFGGITGATTNGTAVTLTAPVLGTPASGTLTNCAGLPVAGLTDSALTVAARTANSSGTLSALSIATDGHTVKRSGTSLVSASYGPASVSLLTTGTGATYTVPAAIYRLKVTVIGAGGGAGGCDQDGTGGGSGTGGAAGAVAIKFYSTTPGATFTYTVSSTGGAGGTAGNNSGTAGASSTFDNAGSIVTGTGGNGGGSQAAGTTIGHAGASTAVVATGGDINLTGPTAQRGLRLSNLLGFGTKGADGFFGQGGTTAINADGGAAAGYGAGGGGSFVTSAGTDRAGGNGAPGLIIVEEYN